MHSADDSSSGCVLPAAKISVYSSVQSQISVTLPTTLIYMQRATENTGDDKYCWRLKCVGVRREVFCFLEVGFFFLLPPAWRGEPECGARRGPPGAPEARKAAGCQPGPESREGRGLDALTGTSWRNEANGFD